MTYPDFEEMISDKPYREPIDIDELLPEDFFDWDEIGISESTKKDSPGAGKNTGAGEEGCSSK